MHGAVDKTAAYIIIIYMNDINSAYSTLPSYCLLNQDKFWLNSENIQHGSLPRGDFFT